VTVDDFLASELSIKVVRPLLPGGWWDLQWKNVAIFGVPLRLPILGRVQIGALVDVLSSPLPELLL
jgi:hypothetical protein